MRSLARRLESVLSCWQTEADRRHVQFFHQWVHKLNNETLHLSAFSMARLVPPTENATGTALEWRFGGTPEWLTQALHAAYWTYSQTVGLVLDEFAVGSKTGFMEVLEQGWQDFRQAHHWESTGELTSLKSPPTEGPPAYATTAQPAPCARARSSRNSTSSSARLCTAVLRFWRHFGAGEHSVGTRVTLGGAEQRTLDAKADGLPMRNAAEPTQCLSGRWCSVASNEGTHVSLRDTSDGAPQAQQTACASVRRHRRRRHSEGDDCRRKNPQRTAPDRHDRSLRVFSPTPGQAEPVSRGRR